MKKIKFPSAQSILLIIAALVTILTWIVPAGKYSQLLYDKEAKVFNIKSTEASKNVAATTKTLDSLGIKIPLEKFTEGDIWKPINIPNTYKQLASKPQGFFDFAKAPIKGIIAGADIIFLILFIGGLVGLMNTTGAFDAGISWLAKVLKDREYILIILVTALISIGGTTFGLAEETMAFYPILIPVFLAAKYDAMVGLACIFVGSSVGSMFSTTNPFSCIIASNASGINWTTGLTTRFIVYVIATIICIIYIMRYAKKVKNDPTRSIIYDQKEEIETLFLKNSGANIPLTSRLRLILFVFTMCFVVMIFGVAKLEWWFLEMTTTFFVGAILIGFISKIKEDTFIDSFLKGAGELLGVALIVGIARGITVIMEDGLISDTMLFYASSMTEGMNKGLFANMMFFIYGGLSFFIPSSSGMAVLTMPIMSPLADGVGVGRELVVDAYIYGMGLFAFINPTSLVLASLAMIKVGYDKWLKFIMPLFFILLFFTMIVLTISAYT
jgi:uncharacterized ion transporter superfamily protein YfcC